MTHAEVTDSIDVSVTVRHGMRHWPDNPPIVLERVLFRTSNSDRCWQSSSFVEDFVSLSEQAAARLAERGVRTVGLDCLSVGAYHADGATIHKILLQAGIWIIEGLDLSAVTGGRYEMIYLPVKLHGSFGAPARAILRPIGPGQAVPAEAGP